MKSRIYTENLAKYPEMIIKLKDRRQVVAPIVIRVVDTQVPIAIGVKSCGQ
jgi:hypothetical protein